MAKDSKYGTVTVDGIPEDEPIVIFRGQDSTLPRLLTYYRMLCQGLGCPDGHVRSISRLLADVKDWQDVNPEKVKLPD